MRKLSLFSGIGGIDLAAKWAGIETVAFCEKEPFPRKVLKKHWPDIPIYDDVRTLTKEVLEQDGIITRNRTIDLISAGYPCQPFSHAGKRKGKEDDRARDGKGFYILTLNQALNRISTGRQMHWMHSAILFHGWKKAVANPRFSEVMMGFPIGWTEA
ncbi:DNA cytosine methyltransferase [Paenibacillus larvae]|uniref:DNA cytosine methyltransferase n=1 Tax=Paenibacillus larvae TaxID=1464 RepID=UPI002E0F60D8|nr:DNA cytosine methyltransferase [Paenibacillus larvae]